MMAGYKNHIIFGIIFSLTVSLINYYFNFLRLKPFEIILIAPVIFFYSILPDIDISSSKARQIIIISGLILLLISLYFNIRLASYLIIIILLLFQFTKHRRFFHTITAAILFSSPLIMFNYMIATFAFIGYVSHLTLDGSFKII